MRTMIAILFLLVACGNRGVSSAPVTFSDSLFAEGDWHQQVILNTATQGGANSVQASGDLGDDAYRLTSLYMQFVRSQYFDQRMIIANFFNGGSYSPQLSGAIKSIEYSIDVNGWRSTAMGLGDYPPYLSVRFAMMQGDRFHVGGGLAMNSTPQTQWITLTDGPFSLDNPTHVGATARDFFSYPDYLAGTKPNFSEAGETVHFGYIVEFSDDAIYSPTGLGGASGAVYVDNFSVSIRRVPEPNMLPSGIAAFAALASLVTRRKRPAV